MRWSIFSVAAALALTAPAAQAAAVPPPLSLAGAPDGWFEIREGTAVLARVPIATAPLRRGTPSLHETDVDGHRVAELRVPVRGKAAEEVWIADVGARPPQVIWTGSAGARDADGEVSIAVEVSPDGIVEYQTATQVTRCDGVPPRLFPRAFDFDSKRFRPILSPLPEPVPASQRLTGHRGDPAMPAGRPIDNFHFLSASTTTAAGSDARALAAPAALDDGDPATAWAEGLGGDGRGEFLTARAAAGGYAIRGLRIFPGDGSSAAAFRAKNRVRRLQIALGPALEQRFEVELPSDAAADAAHWREPYWVPLPKPMASSCVTVVILEVARGTEAAPPKSYGTTAIGDIAIFTELDGPDGAEHLVADLAKAADCPSRIPLVVSLGQAAVLPTAQAVMSTKGPSRECLVEALTSLEPAPKNPIVAEALIAAVAGATPKEERLVTAALRRAAVPPVGALGDLLASDKALVDDRIRAARVLGALEDERAPGALVAAAGVGPTAVRAAVADALALSPALRAEALLEAVAHAPSEGAARYADLVRVLPAAVKHAPERRADAVAALKAALAPDRPFEVRGRAVMALGMLGSTSPAAQSDALAPLVALRADSDEPALRYLAARELVTASGGEALAALRAALDDRDPRVRETAALGLGQHRARDAGQSLIAGAKQEPWPFVRRAELEALGHLCVAGTGDLMIRATERDVDQVRHAALGALVRCKDPRATKVLLRTLAHPTEAATLRELAASLLGELGNRSVTPTLAATLDHLVNESEADMALEGVATSALRALARLGGREAVVAAVKLARDTRHPLRRPAIEALGTLCDPGDGAATLHAIVTGNDPALAAAAQSAERRCQH
jgi:HEAT repeat protein